MLFWSGWLCAYWPGKWERNILGETRTIGDLLMADIPVHIKVIGVESLHISNTACMIPMVVMEDLAFITTRLGTMGITIMGKGLTGKAIGILMGDGKPVECW
jgi:uncharacterized protein YuzE